MNTSASYTAGLEQLPPVIVKDSLLPVISIVTPSYNQGKYIRETIESVLTQAYPNIEYWVIDGGSTDETVAVLKEYEHDPRFHWLSEPDKGQSDAINKGLARCRGEIWSWLNSDDCLLPGALRHVANCWLDLPQPAMIYGLARLIDQNGNDLGYGAPQSPRMTLQKLLRCESIPFQPATFAPAQTVRDVGAVDTSFHYAMDLDLFIKLAERIPIKHIRHDLAAFRLHPTSKSVSQTVEFIADIERVLQSAEQRGLVTREQVLVRSNLVAMRVYLMPGILDFALALRSATRALGLQWTTFPLVIYGLLKGVVRLAVGDKLWAKVRLIRAKVA